MRINRRFTYSTEQAAQPSHTTLIQVMQSRALLSLAAYRMKPIAQFLVGSTKRHPFVVRRNTVICCSQHSIARSQSNRITLSAWINTGLGNDETHTDTKYNRGGYIFG